MTLLRTTFVSLTLALAASGVCDETADLEAAEAEPEPIEEVIVYGEMNLVQLRFEVYRAEETFFDVFNSLNTISDFEVDCDFKVSLQTRRRTHECTPRYYRRLEAANARSTMLDGGFSVSLSDHDTVKQVERKKEQMVDEMLKILIENPELQTAFNDLTKARSAYENRRQEP